MYISFIPGCYDQCTHSGYTDRGAHPYCAENESALSTLKLVVKFQSSLVMMCNIQGFRCLINAMTSKECGFGERSEIWLQKTEQNKIIENKDGGLISAYQPILVQP